MGSDKGLLVWQGKPWVVHAMEKLQQTGLVARVSVSGRQRAAYQEIVESVTLVPDNAGLPVAGPLLGLLSAHVFAPAEDLFALACDLPLMKPELLRNLAVLHGKNPGYDAYLYQNGDEPEPLCGIYTARALAGILAGFRENPERSFGLKAVLRSLRVLRVPLEPDHRSSFRNFNTPDFLFDT